MTIIKGDTKVQVLALHDAGLSALRISRQLNLNVNTVKSFLHKFKLNRDLPPAIKRYKGYFQGRIPLQIKNYLSDNPTATTHQVLEALELSVSEDALNKWMNANNLTKKGCKAQYFNIRC